MRVETKNTTIADNREKEFLEYTMVNKSIDPGIRKVVILLNRHGLKTTGSCEGGDGHAFDLPTVVLKDTGKVTADMIAGVLIGAGFAGFTVAHHRFYQDAPIPWELGAHNFVVEFWRSEKVESK